MRDNPYIKEFDKENNEFDNKRRNYSGIMTADQYLGHLSKDPPLRSRDKNLDELLGGGFRKGLVHLLIGPRKVNSRILLKTAVSAFMSKEDGGLGAHKIAYIDGDNRFAPYLISQYALSMNMNPREILSNIYVARAFNWSQMVELAQVKLSKMKGIDLILISGLTGMLEINTSQNNEKLQNLQNNVHGRKNEEFSSENNRLDQKAFEDLKSSIDGIKKAIENSEPIVVITAPKHKDSIHKPVGGKILTHFGCVIVEIIQMERRTDYILAQHPFITHKKVIKWNRITDQIMEKYTKWDMDAENGYNNKEKVEQVLIDGKITEKSYNKEEIIENFDDPKSDEWKETMNLPETHGFIKEIKNLRLKNKRNKTSNKGNQNKTQNLTLDYYLKK